jgi:hypothetical protein
MIKEFIETWYETHNARANFALIKQIANNKEYISELETSVCIKSNSIEQLLYHYINDVKVIPECPNCSKQLDFKSLSVGYLIYCSKGCKTSYEHKEGKFAESHVKGGQTFKENFGKNSKNHFELERRKQETCKERFGVSHPMKVPSVVAKHMNTCIANYGETNPMKSDIVKDKVKSTNFNIWSFSSDTKYISFRENVY